MGTDQERTQEATPRYRAKVRASGLGPRSQMVVPALSILLLGLVASIIRNDGERFGEAFGVATACAAKGATLDAAALAACAREVASAATAPTLVTVVWLAVGSAALIASLASGSISFSPGAISPQLARLSISTGLRRIVNFENLWHAGVCTLLIALLACVTILSAARGITASAYSLNLGDSARRISHSFMSAWQRATGLFLVVAVVDVLWARARFASLLRMTPRQAKEDRAQTEARPEVKQRRITVGARRVRSLRVTAIRKATAVVVNPAHVAVALRYAPPAIDVPIVVARGAELTAVIVRHAARQYDVPIIESPELARTLYMRVDVDEPIPEDCYAAVAAIFAWIVRVHGVLRGAEDSGS